ncbi:MAG TPA: cytochrome c [Gaiellaceae bacterium]|nr:cytochrome c [Gaiellaceae bacterium]
MRRLAPLLGVSVLLLAGCGGGKTVSATPETVVGTVATTSTQPSGAGVKGSATAGAALFKSKGCDGCHTFTPAGSTATVGPDLDKLADLAKKANMGSEADFVHQSIQDPGAYVESGYQNIMPDFGAQLSQQQIADLVAYLTTKG